MTDPYRNPDFYTALGVSAEATPDEITRAYRRLARQQHPDANPEATADGFAMLATAYDVLRDPERRRRYDDTRNTRASNRGAGRPIPIRHVAVPRTARHSPANLSRPQEADVEIGLSSERDPGGPEVVASVEICPGCGGAGAKVRRTGGIRITIRCRECRGTGTKIR